MTGRGLASVLAGLLVCLAVAASAENHIINVVDIDFEPREVTIRPGDTVTFQKGGTAVAHNVRSNGFTGSCTTGPNCFRSGGVTTGSFSLNVEFPSPGMFRFFCDFHGTAAGTFPNCGMCGRIIVEEDEAPPPPPPPPPPPQSDDPGQIRFTSANYNRNEGIGSAVIQVERFSGDDGAVGVSFATSNGTAIAGQDYTTANGALAWADGEDGVKTFSVPITNDVVDEPNETVNLALSAPTGGATLGNPSSATLTIVDDDGAAAAGSVGFTSATWSAGEAEAFATVLVGRTGGTQGAVSVEWETADGSARAGEDYTAVGGTLDWAAGDAADKMIQIPLLDDTDFEGDETLSVLLSQPTGGATVAAPAVSTVTLNDNEAVPPCEDGEHSVCLLDRFLVRLRFATQGGQAGDARAAKLTDSSAAFEFFDPGNVEIVVKMRDACAFPAGNPLRNFWVFVAGLTNVRVESTLIDTTTGTVRRFHNALNQPFFTAAPDSPDGRQNPPGAIQATSVALGAFPTCDA